MFLAASAPPQLHKRSRLSNHDDERSKKKAKFSHVHSYEEILMACYIAHTLFYRTPSVIDIVMKALQLGDGWGKSDMVFDMSGFCWCDGIDTIVIEYDGVYYHSKMDSTERDMRKTQKILDVHKTSLVVRIRDGGLDNLPMEEGLRLLQVRIPQNISSMAEKAKLVVEAILLRFPQCTNKSAVIAHTYTSHVLPIELMCVEVLEQFDDMFRQHWKEMVALLDDEYASAVQLLSFLKDHVGMTIQQITTFMNGGVAAHIGKSTESLLLQLLQLLKVTVGLEHVALCRWKWLFRVHTKR